MKNATGAACLNNHIDEKWYKICIINERTLLISIIYRNIITDPFCRVGKNHASGATYLYMAGETGDDIAVNF